MECEVWDPLHRSVQSVKSPRSGVSGSDCPSLLPKWETRCSILEGYLEAETVGLRPLTQKLTLLSVEDFTQFEPLE